MGVITFVFARKRYQKASISVKVFRRRQWSKFLEGLKARSVARCCLLQPGTSSRPCWITSLTNLRQQRDLFLNFLASGPFDPAKYLVVTASSTPLTVGPATVGKSGERVLIRLSMDSPPPTRWRGKARLGRDRPASGYTGPPKKNRPASVKIGPPRDGQAPSGKDRPASGWTGPPREK